MDDLYPPELRDLVGRAFSRMRRRLGRGAPTLSVRAQEWMRSLAGDVALDSYFTHPQAFPMLLLPWWLETEIRGVPDGAFHGDVAYSTLNGYYFVRMIDDLMDREASPGSSVLPVLIFFHTEFLLTYHRHFPYGHPFWDQLAKASLLAAETASRDADLPQIDRAQFLEISARKIAGAKIPIAAVCHRYERPELIAAWSDFVDLLGCWHQMLNDMRGWQRDVSHGRSTHFLSQATLRGDSVGSIAEWVISEGLPWGLAQLDAWMLQLLAAARELACPSLIAYLEQRRRSLETESEGLMTRLVALDTLASELR